MRFNNFFEAVFYNVSIQTKSQMRKGKLTNQLQKIQNAYLAFLKIGGM